MTDDERFSRGMEVRRSVLGDAHVDAATKSITDLDRDFQNFITRYAWGEIWNREGLPRTTRSMITIAVLVALSREDELRMHLRAALKNGVSLEEIKEVLMHCAIYCGLPAANAAFKIARDVLSQQEK